MKNLSEAKHNVHEDIRGTIGNTPLVRLRRVASELACPLYAKLEMFNPGGSVKDRIAFRIVEGYENSGALKPGGTVVEATSGNTGVGLAIACALKGYQAVFVMPDKMSDDKVRLLRAYGARVVITPTAVAPEDPRSYYSVARRLARETPNAVLANQYHNPLNPESHFLSTGPEILAQTAGRVTDIVIGMGTGGTITGVSRAMRAGGHAVRIIGVDPQGSLLRDAWAQGGSAEGLAAQTYKVEGIGEDFIPGTLDLSLVDEVVSVDDAESFYWARRLVREEGILAGGSSGSALAGAIKAAADYGPERLVVVLLPDTGTRYLTKVFNDDWMREHGFLGAERDSATVLQVSQARGEHELITARLSDTKQVVIERMRSFGVSQLPVIGEQGELLGMITERVMLNHLLLTPADRRGQGSIEELVDSEVRRVGLDEPFEDVLPDLLEARVLVLVDGQDRPQGILTMIDALEFAARRPSA